MHVPLSVLPCSLDGSGRPREDGGVRLPAGAGRRGAAGQPAGRLPSVLRRQAGTLAGAVTLLHHPSVQLVPALLHPTCLNMCLCVRVLLFFCLFF